MFWESLDVEPKEFHKPDSSLDPSLGVHPDNGIASGHDHLPDDVARVLGGLEVPELGDVPGFTGLLPVDELTYAHPQVVDVPALEDASEVLPEQHAFKPVL